jgi:hypothetical protein
VTDSVPVILPYSSYHAARDHRGKAYPLLQGWLACKSHAFFANWIDEFTRIYSSGYKFFFYGFYTARAATALPFEYLLELLGRERGERIVGVLQGESKFFFTNWYDLGID